MRTWPCSLPIVVRPLRRDECLALDQYLSEHKLGPSNVLDAFNGHARNGGGDGACRSVSLQVRHGIYALIPSRRCSVLDYQARANFLRREAAEILQSLLGRVTRPPALSNSMAAPSWGYSFSSRRSHGLIDDDDDFPSLGLGSAEGTAQWGGPRLGGGEEGRDGDSAFDSLFPALPVAADVPRGALTGSATSHGSSPTPPDIVSQYASIAIAPAPPLRVHVPPMPLGPHEPDRSPHFDQGGAVIRDESASEAAALLLESSEAPETTVGDDSGVSSDLPFLWHAVNGGAGLGATSFTSDGRGGGGGCERGRGGMRDSGTSSSGPQSTLPCVEAWSVTPSQVISSSVAKSQGRGRIGRREGGGGVGGGRVLTSASGGGGKGASQRQCLVSTAGEKGHRHSHNYGLPHAPTEAEMDEDEELEQTIGSFATALGGSAASLELRLPPTLSGRQRKVAHAIAERYGLLHQSSGSGSARSLLIAKDAARKAPRVARAQARAEARAAAAAARESDGDGSWQVVMPRRPPVPPGAAGLSQQAAASPVRAYAGD